jgi:hypothetical protein
MFFTMSTAGCNCSIQSSGCGSTDSVMPSRSRMGSSSSMERNQAASHISPVWAPCGPPAERSGDAPRPNSDTISAQSISRATSMAFLQQRMAHCRSSSKGLAQRYMGCSDASATPLSRIACRNAAMRSRVARGITHQSRKSLRGDSSIWS